MPYWGRDAKWARSGPWTGGAEACNHDTSYKTRDDIHTHCMHTINVESNERLASSSYTIHQSTTMSPTCQSLATSVSPEQSRTLINQSRSPSLIYFRPSLKLETEVCSRKRKREAPIPRHHEGSRDSRQGARGRPLRSALRPGGAASAGGATVSHPPGGPGSGRAPRQAAPASTNATRGPTGTRMRLRVWTSRDMDRTRASNLSFSVSVCPNKLLS